MAEEPPRERLFDVLMRRLEALAPHKAAIRSLLRSARRHPEPRVGPQRTRGALAAMDADGRRISTRPGPRGHACAPRAWRCCSPGCCAPSSRTTRTTVSPAPWRRSTVRSRAASAGPAFLDDLCRFAPRGRCLSRFRRRRRDEERDGDPGRDLGEEPSPL